MQLHLLGDVGDLELQVTINDDTDGRPLAYSETMATLWIKH